MAETCVLKEDTQIKSSRNHREVILSLLLSNKLYVEKGHRTGQKPLPENCKLKNYQSPYMVVRHSISDQPEERFHYTLGIFCRLPQEDQVLVLGKSLSRINKGYLILTLEKLKASLENRKLIKAQLNC